MVWCSPLSDARSLIRRNWPSSSDWIRALSPYYGNARVVTIISDIKYRLPKVAFSLYRLSKARCTARPCGATVARLTPDQKVACSNHVGVMPVVLSISFCTFLIHKMIISLIIHINNKI